MKRLTDLQKRQINTCVREGLSRREISKIMKIPEGTISHYQNPRKKEVIIKDKIFLFYSKDLKTHNNLVAERAYRKAAVCTVNKLMCLSEMPIQKAIEQICKYQLYLINEYDLKSDGKRRVK